MKRRIIISLAIRIIGTILCSVLLHETPALGIQCECVGICILYTFICIIAVKLTEKCLYKPFAGIIVSIILGVILSVISAIAGHLVSAVFLFFVTTLSIYEEYKNYE